MPDEQNAAGTSSAGETTPSGDEGKQKQEGQTVPLNRFQSVNRERKEGLETIKALQKTNEDLRIAMEKGEKLPEIGASPAGGNGSVVGALPDVPEHLKGTEAAGFLINAGMQSGTVPLVEKALGMPLSEVRKRLADTVDTKKASAEVAYSQLCANHGVDPKDEDARALFVAGMNRVGEAADAGEIMQGVTKRLHIVPKDTGGAKIETSGVGEIRYAKTRIPSNRKEAQKMAKDGERVPDTGILEILENSDRSKKAGTA